MFKIWVLSLGFTLFYNFRLVASDESCQLTEKPKLQVVFVVSFTLNRETYWGRWQFWSAGNITNAIKAQFPDTQFAVAGFVDYPDSATPTGRRPITNPEVCYFLIQNFTTETGKIVSAVQNPQPPLGSNYYNDQEDSVTAAMLFASADKKLKWNPGFYDSEGKIVRKIMIPMVWTKITKVLKTPGNRTKPKGDGSDTCSNALLPTFKHLSNILYEKGFAVFNSILNGVDKLIEGEYSKHFASLLVPYYQFPLPRPGSTSSWEETSRFSFRGYANLMLKQIQKEVMTCDWEDPKGYNSLGL